MEKTKEKITKYDESSIKILKGLEAVRKRPAMYIGDVEGIDGLYQMLFEVLDNSIDESLVGYCDNITVILHKDKSVTVQDNGRGIPIGMHLEEKKPVPEVLLTVLHAGGKFDTDSYEVSGGLHGVGISVVNALSDHLELTIQRDNTLYKQTFSKGIPNKHTATVSPSDNTGTTVSFLADPTIFTITDFNYNDVYQRLDELAYLNPKITLHLLDERTTTEKKFKHSEGIKKLLQNKFGEKKIINPITIEGKHDKITVDLAFFWSECSGENILCFTNNIFQKEGGAHLSGFKQSLAKIIQNYIKNSVKSTHKTVKDLEIISEDIREGICAIITLKLPDPKFSSQTKEKLISGVARTAVDQVLSDNFNTFLLENPDITDQIINKVVRSYNIRQASKHAKEIIKKENVVSSIGVLPGKLTDCQTKDAGISELFLVEGDSAGGTAKAARSRFNQAILPLKGKIINVEKTIEKRIVSFDEIVNIVLSLGCGWKNDFELTKLRYNKVIIMTDADDDGLHIRCLLLTLFFRYMTPLVSQGHVYIAQPPLFSVKQGRKDIFLKDEQTLNDYLFKNTVNNTRVTINNQVINKQVWSAICNNYQRFLASAQDLYKFYPSNFIQAISHNRAYEQDEIWWNTVLEYMTNNSNNTYQIVYSDNHVTLQEFAPDGSKLDYAIPHTLFNSKHYQHIVNNYLLTQEYEGRSTIRFDNQVETFDNLANLIDWVYLKSRESIALKRYKGLGSLNADQLWDTTMNPDSRSLVKISLGDAEEANKYFTILMGSDVTPRKQYLINKSDHIKIDV